MNLEANTLSGGLDHASQSLKIAEDAVIGKDIRKASLFFGGRSEKRLGRISPPQNSVIGGRMHSEEEGEEALLTRL